MSVFYQDHSVQILHGDVLDMLKTLPDGYVQTCVTSPPYWGLRDYGTAKWEGGNSDCSHAPRSQQRGSFDGGMPASLRDKPSLTCKCGALRIDNQIGLEPTPDAYVATMVAVFREVRRVLKDDGTLWLNLGDTYSAGSSNPSPKHSSNNVGMPRAVIDLAPKNLCGIPWRVAFALQADGWYLRSDIIWAKPNPMPESVTDRPTKAHEYIFLMSKSERYYYDEESIREQSIDPESINGRNKRNLNGHGLHDPKGLGRTHAGFANMPEGKQYLMRNKRTVWDIATHSYPEAHFATFPPKLIEPCILAGSRPNDLVLDCFHGAGTTAMVSKNLGRKYVGIELNQSYIEMSLKRIEQEVLPL